MSSYVVTSQNKIDFGIYASSTANQMEVRIRPNYAESGHYITNAQFTIRWLISSGITSLTAGTLISPYFLNVQGSVRTNGNYYYQTWATNGGYPVTWSANQQIVIQTFTYTGSVCPYFEIAHDAFVQSDAVNGDYYFEINGNQTLTGIIYYTSTPAPSGNALQYFCSAATVADLVADGTAIKWYSAATGGTALLSTTALVNGTAYYATQTISGVESTSRFASIAYYGNNKTFNLKFYFDALYLGNGLMMEVKGGSNSPMWGSGIADKFTVDLHNPTNYSQIVYEATNVSLSTSGNATLIVPCNLMGSYYVTIKGRNSIETVSSSAVSFAGSTISYNFSSSATQTYGGNIKAVAGGYYTIFAGDVSQDGIVDGSDMALVDNASSQMLMGYNVTDVNGDGIVDGSDMAIVDNNSSAIIRKITP